MGMVNAPRCYRRWLKLDHLIPRETPDEDLVRRAGTGRDGRVRFA